MTDHVANKDRVLRDNNTSMYKLSLRDSLTVFGDVHLDVRAPNSTVATMASDTRLTLGKFATASALGTAFLGAGNNIKVVMSSGAEISSATGYGLNLLGSRNVIENAGRITTGYDYDHVGLGAISSGGMSSVSNTGWIGNLNAGFNAGLSFSAGGNDVVNAGAGSLIAGGFHGIRMMGGDNTIVNEGRIGSERGMTIYIGSTDASQSNLIQNSGVIKVENHGSAIFINGPSQDKVLNISHNANPALIQGNISLGTGNDEIVNTGVIRGFIDMGSDNDRIVTNGRIYGDVQLGSGNDVFYGSAGYHYDLSGANAGRIFGGDGADTIIGGLSNDIIFGGEGNDYLVGTPGKDAFVFDTKLHQFNIDRIVNFDVTEDRLWLDNRVFNLGYEGLDEEQFCIGREAYEADHRIIYDIKTGAVAFDRDGSGETYHAVVFARVDPFTDLTASHFLTV